MIKNKITYAGQTILTIYHNGFDNAINQRKTKIREKIGRFNIIFEEETVSDHEVSALCNTLLVKEGFLVPNHEYNPYSESGCAHLTHYINFDKPNKIFKILESEYIVSIPITDFQKINLFVKKYTGLNIEKNPILYGDILVYNYFKFSFEPNESNGIVFENIASDSTLVIKFKKESLIVFSKITYFESSVSKFEVNSPSNWNSFDLEIYMNDELYFLQENISYMRSIQLKFRQEKTIAKVRINQLSEHLEMKGLSTEHVTQIGEPNDEVEEVEEVLVKSNLNIRKKILKEQEKENLIFITPGELEKAIQIIIEFLQVPSDEVWIFDPYFTDKNGLKKAVDWLRILSHCRIQNKKIVFYCKNPENAYDHVTIIEELKLDPILNELIKSQKLLAIEFIEVKSPIHDRFIISRTKDEFSGITIGTSLNSMDRNHFCINRLNHSAAKKITTELIKWIESGNVIGINRI
ncbi:hypothetical protein P4T04_10040 [Bacillus badius]|uniref:hypothetical protein n=1 Tax=Bacillus badius TaxID=1455 RepID=UPI002E1ED607|nr:hypothetical protein [Bacillus badius]